MHISNISIYLIISVPVLRFAAYFVQERCYVLVSWLAENLWEMVQSSCLRLLRPILSLDFAKNEVENAYELLQRMFFADAHSEQESRHVTHHYLLASNQSVEESLLDFLELTRSLIVSKL